eukprot:4065089-Pyramimonas_sp.AAC.1
MVAAVFGRRAPARGARREAVCAAALYSLFRRDRQWQRGVGDLPPRSALLGELYRARPSLAVRAVPQEPGRHLGASRSHMRSELASRARFG